MTKEMEDKASEDPAASGVLNGDAFSVPDNVIHKGIAEYGEKDQDDLLWLASYTRLKLGGSRSRLCEKLDCTWSTAWKILCGKYDASIESFMESVRDLRRRVESGHDTGFITTPLTTKIFELLDYAKAGDMSGGKMVMVCGPTRRGKSETVKEWGRLNNHGGTIYVDCPETGGLRGFLLEIAKQTGQNKKASTFKLRQAIYDSFNRRRVLVVDEVLRLLPGKKGERRPTELEFIRRLHDVTRCPVVLVATPVFATEMNSGWLQDYMEQFIGRLPDTLFIPERVTKAECRAICAAFLVGGGEPGAELVTLAHKIANERGKLGVLFELLRQASALAGRRKERLGAQHLSAAYQRRQARSTFTEEKEGA